MIEEVRSALVEFAADRWGSTADLSVGEPAERQWSWQIPVRVDRPAKDLILKIPRWEEVPTLEKAIGRGPQDSTLAEYQTLAGLFDAVARSGQPGLGAIEAVGFLPSVNGILMSVYPGVRLRTRLRPTANRAAGDRVFRRAGRLASVFHGLGEIERRPFDVGRERNAVERMTEGSSRRLPRRLLELAADVRGWAGDFSGADEPWGGVHGDLNLDNVLVDDSDRVALVDPNPGSGPLLRDHALLLGDLDLDRRQLATFRLWRGRAACRAWAEEYLEAAGAADEPVLAFRRAAEAVERWARLEQATGPRRAALIPARRVLAAALRNRLGDG